MSALVQKGQKVNITKISPKIDKITVKVEWNVQNSSSNDFEIDMAAICICC